MPILACELLSMLEKAFSFKVGVIGLWLVTKVKAWNVKILVQFAYPQIIVLEPPAQCVHSFLHY